MFLARRFAAAVTAWLLIIAAIFVSAGHLQAEEAGKCEDASEIAILFSPIAPWKGAPLRVIFAGEKRLDGELSLVAPDGSVAAKSDGRYGGPPYFWFAEAAAPAAGTWQAKLTREAALPQCQEIVREITVKTKKPRGPRAGKGVWPVQDAWDRDTENLYSAWIEKLFDAPLDESLSWKAMHEVLRDHSRNVLFNHLGLGEDEKGLVIRPDCADLPYFLRAYFAFKMSLPFGYTKCTRGGGGQPPKCQTWWNIVKEEPAPRATVVRTQPRRKAAPRGQRRRAGGRTGFYGMFAAPAPAPVARPRRVQTRAQRPQRPRGLVPGFGFYLQRTVADGVHSGNGRTAADDDNTDYYPVPLSEESLRPGTVYADPYGHILVLVKRIPQTGEGAGLFLAIDGQPDGTVARKRFWRGNFLFAQDPALGGPGFKRFRPVVREKNGTLRRLTNEEIAENPEYGDFSLQQAKLDVEDFYDRMDDVMSPAPLDPMRAMKEAVTALEEQVNARVTSVENGRKFLARGGKNVAMPDGASIFETSGPWEDFATPSRDLRLLIAIDVVRKFPERVARRPDRYAMPEGKSAAEVKAELDATLASELAAREFSYTRTDGSKWALTIKDVLDRITDLEMAYNINDCVELRWGAPGDSDEASTCKKHAPEAQRKKMAEYRPWFHERRRPPR